LWKNKLDGDFYNFSLENINYYETYLYLYREVVLPSNYSFVLTCKIEDYIYKKYLLTNKSIDSFFIGSLRDIDFMTNYNFNLDDLDNNQLVITIQLSYRKKHFSDILLTFFYTIDIMELIKNEKYNYTNNINNIEFTIRHDIEQNFFATNNIYKLKLTFPSFYTEYENICDLLLQKINS
jgi:hypothetical protein